MKIRRNSPSNRFGRVRSGGKRVHQGEDYQADIGTPILAVDDGVVAFIRNGGDYGLQICIKTVLTHNGNPVYAFYAHLSRVDVKACQQLKSGQPMGATGDTGNARGMRGEDCHLHFEVRTRASPGLGLGGRLDPRGFVRYG
ncbi:M23 family metallopeptidase [Formosimonas limnophila]|uniref:M23 family metallopeptidase n=1 Tax=Formosimonas limnophila TaxID=1384487 RepID=UPI00167AC8E6|nr:M23 family metallopeptidase [Formosimonas limnophila]